MKRLPKRQKGKFLDRSRKIDFEDAWDRRIETDAEAGRLEQLWQRAVKDVEAGNIKSIDEVISLLC